MTVVGALGGPVEMSRKDLLEFLGSGTRDRFLQRLSANERMDQTRRAKLLDELEREEK